MNTCLQCQEPFMGRMDKKYCSDQCRSEYNNHKNRLRNKYVYEVNKILKNNRKILQLLNPSGTSKVHKDMLVKQGFRFDHFTNILETRSRKTYYFCYEYGYLPLGQDFYMIVIRDYGRKPAKSYKAVESSTV